MTDPLTPEAVAQDAEEVLARAKAILARVQRMEFTRNPTAVSSDAATAMAAFYVGLSLALPWIPPAMMLQLIGRYYEEMGGLMAEQMLERLRHNLLLHTLPTDTRTH